MADIILTTINARFAHASLALRCLQANLGDLQARSVLIESVLGSDTAELAEQLLAEHPRIIGISVSIWNALESAALVRLLKAISPETVLVLGGPEVSHLPHRVDFSLADWIIVGEGETTFRELCLAILAARVPHERVIHAKKENLDRLLSPYSLYSDHDLANRVTYVEASRGCPFGCEFCLSSIDKTVRYFPLESFIADLDYLWQRGARHFKFIDRTFNLDLKRATSILDYFLAKEPPYLLHLEMVPENFPDVLKERLCRFSPASLQLEVGIQTLDPEVAARIGRAMDMKKIQVNLAFLREETSAHLHTDLIIGLPGESVENFGQGLDRLVALTGAEVQLGILKKLSGTSLNRHDLEYAMVWSEVPPYALLQNNVIPFAEMQKLKRMARYWDLVYNSGTFRLVLPLLLTDKEAYRPFRAFSDWLYKKSASTHGISLTRLSRFLFEYLTEERGYDQDLVTDALADDLTRATGKTPPPFLRKSREAPFAGENPARSRINRRQRRHDQTPDPL